MIASAKRLIYTYFWLRFEKGTKLNLILRKLFQNSASSFTQLHHLHCSIKVGVQFRLEDKIDQGKWEAERYGSSGISIILQVCLETG